MPENPELYGMGAIVIALITAWSKMRPALKEIESKDDNSLRTDLLNRIKELEGKEEALRTLASANEKALREQHEKNTREIRAEYETVISKMAVRYDEMCKAYDGKLAAFQEKVDLLMDALLESKHLVENKNG